MIRWVFFGIFLILFARVYGGGVVEPEMEEPPQEFVIAHPAEQEPLDPHFFQSPGSLRLWDALFEGLVEADPKTGEGRPGLAESWEVSPDGLIYTFRLRDSFWHDGTPVTAEQVAASWKRILDPATASPHAWYPAMFLLGANDYLKGDGRWEDVGVTPLDSRTLQVELSGPYPFFINALTHPSFAVLPMHLVAEEDSWFDLTRIIGNGDYTIEQPLSEGRIVLHRSSSGPHADASGPESIVFSFTESPAEAFEAYKKGALDWLPSDLFPQQQMGDLKYREDFTAPPVLVSYFYVFNTNRSVLKDARLRRALSLVIDRELLVETVLKGSQIPAYSLVPDLPAYSALRPVPSDQIARLAEARRLFQQAGYPEGKNFPVLNLVYLESEGHQAVAEFLKQQWKDMLNCDVTLSGRKALSYYNDRKNGEFDLSLGGWQGFYQDPSAFLNLFLTGEPVFGGTYSSRDFDKMLVESALVPEGEERYEMLRTAETKLCLEDAAVLPLFFYTAPQLIDVKKWGGFYPNPMDRHPLWNVRWLGK